MNKNHLITATHCFAFSALTIALTACGGGGGGASPYSSSKSVSPASASISGNLIDGPIQGAQVFVDLNNDQARTDNEPVSNATDANGQFTIDVSGLNADELAAATLVSIVPDTARDLDDSGLTLAEAGRAGMTLISPLSAFVTPTNQTTATATVVSPITTLVASAILHDGMKLNQAREKIKHELRLGDHDPMDNYVYKAQSEVANMARATADAMGQASTLLKQSLSQADKTMTEMDATATTLGAVRDQLTKAMADPSTRLAIAAASQKLKPSQLKVLLDQAGSNPIIAQSVNGMPETLSQALDRRSNGKAQPMETAAQTYIVVFKPNTVAKNLVADTADHLTRAYRGSGALKAFAHVFQGFSVTVPAAASDGFLNAIYKNPNVQSVEPEQTVRRHATLNQPAFPAGATNANSNGNATISNPNATTSSPGLNATIGSSISTGGTNASTGGSSASGISTATSPSQGGISTGNAIGSGSISPGQLGVGGALAISQTTALWGLDIADGQRDGAYKFAYNGRGTTAFVVDTGILPGHQQFGDRVTVGTNMLDTAASSADDQGHGSHVAGTIGGTTFGISSGVHLVPVKVLDASGSGTLTSVISGLDWVTQQVANNGALAGHAVVNLSLGVGASPALDLAAANLVTQGIPVIVAAGNDNANACNYSPAREPSVVTVGAVAFDGNSTYARASYSNFGPCIDVFAPGSSITSVGITSTTATATLSGTSMATPHVTGWVAQMLDMALAENGTVASSTDVNGWVISGATSDLLLDVGTGSPNLFMRVSDKLPGSSNGGGSTTSPIEVHVADIQGRSGKAGKNWTAKAVITVVDSSATAVSGVQVLGHFTIGGSSFSVQCTTTANGSCEVSTSALPTSLTAVGYTPDKIAPDTSFTYAALSNAVNSVTIASPSSAGGGGTRVGKPGRVNP